MTPCQVGKLRPVQFPYYLAFPLDVHFNNYASAGAGSDLDIQRRYLG
jgi:hypothetical protein